MSNGNSIMRIVNAHLEHGVKGNVPKLIVIHAMGEFIGAPGWENHAVQFLDKFENNNGSIGLSAHILGAPDGTNYRCRKDDEGAYHASGHNKDSLGYEFLVEGVHNYGSFKSTIAKPYLSRKQYDAGVEQTIAWIKAWNIEQIVRHSDLDPRRKVDPGNGFPWKQFLYDVGKL